MGADFYSRDGPYSWIVLFSIILNNIVCMGFIFSTSGLLVVDYVTLLSVQPAQANIISSFLLGIFLFSVPFNTILVQYFGCRRISGIGFLLAIIGYVSSAFALELWHLVLGYSLLTGLGASMNMTSSIAIVPDYFKKRKNVAYMATGLGSGIAFAVYPVIYSSIRETSSYRNTILYLLPLMACSITAPIIFKNRPPPERPDSFKQLLKSYTNPFRRYITAFYLANAFFWNCTHVGVAVLLYGYVKSAYTDDIATQVQTVMGIMEAVGCLGLTLILLKVKINQFILHIGCNLLTGLACFIMAAYPEKYTLFVTAALIGMLHAITIGNMACVCSHLYQPSHVEYAFGFQEAFGGIGGFLGPFTAGLLQAKHGQPAGFWYLGALIILAGAILIIAAVCNRKIIKPYESHQQAVQQKESEEDMNNPESKL